MFDGVRRAYDLLILYIMNVIEELGTEKSIELLEKAGKRHGVIIAREMRRRFSPDAPILEVGVQSYKKFMEDTGAEIEVYKRDEKSVTFIINRCPFFEAFLDVGVDCGMFLNGLCTHLTLPIIQATLLELDPKLRVDPIITRESAEEFCLERVSIKD